MTQQNCVLSASLRMKIGRIAGPPQGRENGGIACIYGLLLTFPVTP
jgi:hypothetical protein